MQRMQRAKTAGELRRALAAGRTAGGLTALVPTMGALHEGHLSLIRAARTHGAERVVASIFVNPTQFGPGEDLDAYPRDLAGDMEKLRAAGADLVYTPAPEEMYPAGFATTVRVEGPAKAGLEDAFRPTHFDGVATVVAKLFARTGADMAVFGEKDWQQLQVVRRMTRDLDLPVRILAAPTVREADGLAMSSRNAYLTPEERRIAPGLHRALRAARAAILAGTPPEEACAGALETLKEAGFRPDYLTAREAETLAPAKDARVRPLRLLAAARLGKTRLIDNIAV